MTLTLKEVDHIALLARLELSEEERQRYRQQLSKILDHVTQLQELDTAGIAPDSGVQPKHSQLREDQPRPGLTVNEVLQNAPAAEANQFRVPPVLD